MKKIISCIALLPLLLVFGSCTSTTSSTPQSSNVRVSLTDAPMTGVQAVNVTVTAVRFHQSADADPGAAGWQEMAVTAAMPVDLMGIRGGVLYELCSANLAAGHYQQIRLVMAQNAGAMPPFRNSVMTMGGVAYPMDMPADVKIVHSFDVAAGTTTDLTLDFRADMSMRQTGNGSYFMQPVITATSMMR